MISDATGWLLEDENPAIKYRAMTEIIGLADEECAGTYEQIWEQKSIGKMIEKMDGNGIWSGKEWGVHTPLRYLGAFAEHGLRRDPRIDRYVDHTVDFLRMRQKNGDLSGCATPLILRALVMLGYHGRGDVMELIEQFSSAQLFDGGFMCKMRLSERPERKSCYKAAVASLLLYAECKRKNMLPANLDKLIEYFLKRDVFYSSDKTKDFYSGVRPGWRYIDNFFPAEPMRVGLPLIVSALAVLGAGSHPALDKAWALLSEKEDESGRLALEGTLTKQPCSFGKVGEPNKWVTFYSVLASKHK